MTVQSLITAISSGIINQSDLSTVNALRSKLDLPVMTQEKQQQMQLLQQLQQQGGGAQASGNQEQLPDEQQSYS